MQTQLPSPIHTQQPGTCALSNKGFHSKSVELDYFVSYSPVYLSDCIQSALPPPPPPPPVCRAEVVLGNIIKKKGWRYEGTLELSLVGFNFRPSQPFANLVIFFLSRVGRVGVLWTGTLRNGRGKIHAGNLKETVNFSALFPSFGIFLAWSGYTPTVFPDAGPVLHGHTHCGMWACVMMRKKKVEILDFPNDM